MDPYVKGLISCFYFHIHFKYINIVICQKSYHNLTRSYKEKARLEQEHIKAKENKHQREFDADRKQFPRKKTIPWNDVYEWVGRTSIYLLTLGPVSPQLFIS